MKTSWQLQHFLDAVIFDCDGTLSKLEGINELALQNGVGDEVKALTEEAMTTSGVTESLYAERLSLVKPTHEQVELLGHQYFEESTPDVGLVVEVLQRMGKAVFIMSAGLKIAVECFAEHLHIPLSHVYAVEINFDGQGNYKDFDHHSPLTGPDGKGYLVEQLKKKYPSIMHVGDGANDIDTKKHVERFVGYGGVFFRESIRKHSDFYICSESMSPVLALALTQKESEALSDQDRMLYEKGVALIEDSDVVSA